MARHGDKTELERRLEEERAARAREAEAAAASEPGAAPAAGEPPPEEPPADEPVVDTARKEPSDEQRARQLGKLIDGFEAGLRDVFGVDEPLEQLDVDGAIGFMVPGATAFKANDKFRRCQVCNGHGQVLTGSIADGKQTADCPRCDGQGYLTRIEEGQPAGHEPAGGNGAVADDDDAGFGVERWRGDPAVGN